MALLGALIPALPAQPATRVNERDGLVYIWVPAGRFAMGCSPGDTECFPWEPPAREVAIEKGFWLGQTEVTQAAYRRVTGTNPSLYPGENLPVDQIGWDDARQYCAAVGMRLPAEAEWEYAARAGNPAPRYGPAADVAWFDVSDNKTHPVARKQPNAYGFYDLLGNVWEWVQEAYEQDAGKRILRGGSFVNLARDVRVSNRLWAPPGTHHRNMGFRCAAN